MPISYLKSDSLKFVYFVTPKCACSSIKRALLPQLLGERYSRFTVEIDDSEFDVHDFLRARGANYLNKQQFQSRYLRGVFDDYLKFGFVRNPWDRLVSCYESKVSTYGKDPDEMSYHPLKIGGGFEELIYLDMGFDRFARAVANIPDDYANVHFISQYRIFFLSDDYRHPMHDFIGRFESLEVDFETILSQINPDLGVKLPYHNIARRKEESYRVYYTDELRELISNRFSEDISRFGYEF